MLKVCIELMLQKVKNPLLNKNTVIVFKETVLLNYQ